MKAREFLKVLERNGWYLKRHGSNHDIWTNGKERESVPRHPTIDDDLVKAIMKRRGLK